LNIRHRTYEIMERAERGDKASRAFDTGIVTLIGLNVVMVIVETVDTVSQAYGPILHAFEALSVVVFTIEYVLRLWSCTSDPAYRSPILGRTRFALSGFALVDLLAIAPFYLQLFLNLNPTLVGAVRLFRLFRLFKMGRYIRSIRVLGAVVREKRSEMYLVVTVLVIVLIMISSLMYYVEHEAQPEAFSSIPAAMWWGMVTLTTIGYGDVFPVTTLGKFFGILIAMLGIGMFALPAGILSSGFTEAIARDSESTVETSEETANRFVEAINAHDVDGVMRFLADDHTCVFNGSDRPKGREDIQALWASHLGDGSDYAVNVRAIASREDVVLISGVLTDATGDVRPAAWEIRIKNRQIAVWHEFTTT